MTRRFSPRGSLFAGLALSAFVLATLAGALEAILRTTHWLGARPSWSRPDETIGWRFAGNADYWYDSRENDHPIVGRTNSSGWNDRERPTQKSPGTVRVAVLGDSYVEALHVERESNFLSLAETLLNRDGEKRFELMNFGRSGFTQTEEWLVLTREVVNFAPDIVALFYYAPNDLSEVSRRTAADRLRPFPVTIGADEVVLDMSFNRQTAFRIKSFISPLKNHSALVSLVTERVALMQALGALAQAEGDQERGSPATGIRGIGGYLSLATDTADALYEENYAVTKALVTAMIRFCAQRRIGFLLVAIDTPAHVPGVEQRLKAADPTFRFGFFDQNLAEFATGTGAEFLGLEAPFRARYLERGEELHFSQGRLPEPRVLGHLGHPGHWNYAGHQVVAKLLAAKLRSMKTSGGPTARRGTDLRGASPEDQVRGAVRAARVSSKAAL